ncbi:MAG: hypothetical protein ACKO0W_09030, partial [Planctomycetota bacterium]
MVDFPGSGTAAAGLTALSPEAAAALLLAVVVGLPALVVAAVAAIGRRLHREDALVGWCRLVAILYTRWFQKLKAEGTHHIPRTIGP